MNNENNERANHLAEVASWNLVHAGPEDLCVHAAGSEA